MHALTFGDQRVPFERRTILTGDDAITGLLQRLARLVDADCVIALECDPLDQTACVVATLGETHDVDSLADAAIELPRRLDGQLRTRAHHPNGVEVSRLRLGSPHGEVLLAEVELEGASLLLVVTRPVDNMPFTVNEERAARRMGDWIGDYVRLWWRQRRDQRRGDSLHAALDLLGIAVFVLDGRSQLISANCAARLLLDAGDGLRRVGGMITAVSLEDAARLQAAIAHASTGDTTAANDVVQQAPVLAVRRKGLRPLSVAVMRGSAPGLATQNSEGLVVIHAVDPQADTDRSLLATCMIYGLTGAETRLAKLLVGGASLAEAAERLRIQAPTARTYLKQMFLKTGTNRQAALIQLLLTSIVRTGPTVELMALQ
jgi:DNA-binding CsgD family transcriptional regulator